MTVSGGGVTPGLALGAFVVEGCGGAPHVTLVRPARLLPGASPPRLLCMAGLRAGPPSNIAPARDQGVLEIWCAFARAQPRSLGPLTPFSGVAGVLVCAIGDDEGVPVARKMRRGGDV